MRKNIRSIFLILALLASTVVLAAEPVAVKLPDGRSFVLSDAALAKLQRQTVTATAHGKTASYEGYDLRSVLSAAGVAPVENLRGKRLSTYLTVTALDGYGAVFALAELDGSIGNTLVLLVDQENNQALPASDGPWRLVIPSDKRPARWVRQVTSISVSE